MISPALRLLLFLLCIACLPACAMKVAILIGCNEYTAFPPLKGCVADVARMQDCLQQAGYHVYTMTDEAKDETGKPNLARYYPSKANVERQLGIWAARGSYGAGDTLLFYFSGHGMHGDDGDDYLAPLDGGWLSDDEKKAPDPASLLKMGHILELLRQSGAENIFIITDACRSMEGKAIVPGKSFGKGIVGDLRGITAPEQHFLLLRSCTEEQVSFEMPEGQGGWFTRYLVDGLAGQADGCNPSGVKDGAVTAEDLINYVKEQVQTAVARAENQPQVPQMTVTNAEADQLILTGKAKPAPSPAPSAPVGPLTLRFTAPQSLVDKNDVEVTGTTVTISGIVTDLPGVKVIYLGEKPDEIALAGNKDLQEQRLFSYTVSDLSPGLNTLVFEATDTANHRQLAYVRVRCTGTHHFTDLAQRVADAKPGDTLQLEEGEYILSETLTITKSIALVGAGQEKTIIRSTAKEYVINLNTADCELLLKNLTIRYEGGFPADIVHALDGTTTIRQCTLSGGVIKPESAESGDCVSVGSTAHCHVFDSSLRDNEGCGIFLWGTADAIVQNTVCSGNKYYGICLQENASGTFEDNTCEKNASGIYLSDHSHCSLTRNKCQDNTKNGIYLSDNAKATLVENSCLNNTWSGIVFADNSTGDQVSNNHCEGNQTGGIYLCDNANAVLTGNTCINNLDCGIYFNDKSGSTQVKDNTCTGNKYGIYTGKDATVTLGDNTCKDNTEGDIEQEKVD